MQASPDARIKENQVRGWSDDFRLMVERDKRTLEDLDRIIDMVFNDPFWSTVIRSAGKLREQWNAGKVSLDMKRPAIGHTERKRFAYEINAEKKYAGL
jgi:3-hydroxyisobutyrate dehydrogenase-like beta-hydroxyacid dehydrogenase